MEDPPRHGRSRARGRPPRRRLPSRRRPLAPSAADPRPPARRAQLGVGNRPRPEAAATEGELPLPRARAGRLPEERGGAAPPRMPRAALSPRGEGLSGRPGAPRRDRRRARRRPRPILERLPARIGGPARAGGRGAPRRGIARGQAPSDVHARDRGALPERHGPCGVRRRAGRRSSAVSPALSRRRILLGPSIPLRRRGTSRQETERRRHAMTSKKRDTRGHSHELEIEASPETVWKAITDPEELAKWFPISAKARLGPRGSLKYQWVHEFTAALDILQSDPPRHLRTTWMEAVMPAESTADERRRVAVDWFVDGSKGKTALRLVHSGFGADASWEDEFDGTRRGWTYELRSLRHYLERHRGVPRRSFWVRAPFAGEPRAAWEMFTRRMLRKGGVEGLRIGSPYRLTLGSGDVLEGEALIVLPPTDFAGTARIGGTPSGASAT